MGLPLSAEFLADNPHVECVAVKNKDEVKDYYDDGKWFTTDEWYTIHPLEQSEDREAAEQAMLESLAETQAAMLETLAKLQQAVEGDGYGVMQAKEEAIGGE